MQLRFAPASIMAPVGENTFTLTDFKVLTSPPGAIQRELRCLKAIAAFAGRRMAVNIGH
jgi:hypothetical protein